MGYYSDVCLLLNKNGVAILKEKLSSPDICDTTRSEVKSLLADADRHLVDTDSGAECWKWDDVKWYSGDPKYYPDVDFIEKLMLELPEEDFRFMRVGEDYDDLEANGYYLDDPFVLTLRRELVLDC